jgi:uncharacterized protein (DUF2344 family)
MQKCEPSLSQLPDDFPAMDVEVALEVLEVNHVVDSTYYFECKRKQEALTEWINE